MRILYVGAFRLPNKDAAAARVLSNGKVMKALGHSVKFYSWGGEYRLSDMCSDGKFRIEGMEYIITNELDAKGTFYHRLKAAIGRGKLSYDLIVSESSKPDLIILYNADRGWTKKVLKYCNTKGIKVANDITEWYDNNELHIWDVIPYHINMVKTQHLVRNKILISDYLMDYYRGSNNIKLPPLCDQMDSKWTQTIDDEHVPEYEGITLFYAGTPAQKDCIHTVLSVVNELAFQGKPIRFLIAGISKKEYLERYRSRLGFYEIHENIVFLGRVSQDLVPAYYKYADFMVLLREPSRKNMSGFPTKFAESISAGVPVIANITSDLGSYIHDFKTGFRVDSPKAENLKEVLVDKVLRLTRPEIMKMKLNVDKLKPIFDYRSYSFSVNTFLEKLQ